MAAALVTSLQLLAAAARADLDVVLPAMLGVHALIGVGEALITVAALAFIRADAARPARGGRGRRARSRWVVGRASPSRWLVVLLSPLASADPDGLERVAEDIGFLEPAQEAPYAILPDYTVPFLGETRLSTIAGRG